MPLRATAVEERLAGSDPDEASVRAAVEGLGATLDPRILVDFCPIGQNFDGAVASTGNGLYMGLIGALLLMAAGALALWPREFILAARAAGREV